MQRIKKRRAAVARAVLEALEGRRLLSLTAPVYSTVGERPQAVATGDLNGDGRSDVVTANIVGSNVSVLLSDASGALGPAQQFATGVAPRSLAVGDVSGDGNRDVITANGANVSVLLGNGNGTLQAAQNLTLPTRMPPGYPGTDPLPQAPQSVVVGDLNADGKLDLVVNGGTTFYVPYISPYGGTFYWPQHHSHVNVMISSGGGAFTTTATHTLAAPGDTVAVGDFNGDTKLDVITPQGGVTFLAGNGNGTLQAPVVSGGGAYGPPISGDFDGDGKLDLITHSGGFSFSKGLGNGTFAYAQSDYRYSAIRSLVAGDMNGDGKLDLVASTFRTIYESYGYYGGYNPTTSEYTKVLLGFGDGTFSRAASSTIRTYPTVFQGNNIPIALGDLNADGLRDVVSTEPAGNRIFTQLNQPGWIIPGTVRISDAAAVTEGNSGTTNASFTVTLETPPSPAATVSVDYDLVDGTATVAGGDLVDTSGTLTFAPGQTSKTILVPVKGDRVGEFQEDFVVRLIEAGNADITSGRAVGTITDDEPQVWITGGNVVAEGNSGTVPLTFTATLSKAYDAPVTVTYVAVDGTAVGATDYVPVTGTVTFAPGQTTRPITVQVKGDLVAEYEEYFYVNLTGASGALLVNNQASGTITDTDPNPTVSIANLTRAEGPPGTETYFEFVLSLSTRSEKWISVKYATSGGSASSGGGNRDYFSESVVTTIYPGELYSTASVRVIGDSRNESDETFNVNLSLPSDVTIADGQAVGTILDDESRGKTWVGPATGGNWSTASNWSPSGVPVATSLVRIAGASVTASSNITVSELTLNQDAVLTIAPGGNRVVRTAGLFFGYYGVLNLNDNDLIVDYAGGAGNISPLGGWNRWNYTGIAGMIGTGRTGGEWIGWGIVTTRPDALAGLTTLAVGEASQVLNLSGTQTGAFSGQTVDATTVLVKYTHAGDSNLDGTIDADDYAAISFNDPNPSAFGYFNGDFNHDGGIDGDDFALIDFVFNAQGGPL